MNKILITGASGFLGKIILNYFTRQSYLDILTLGRQADCDLIFDLAQPVQDFHIPDSVDVIIHAAGKAHVVPKTENEIQSFYDINFEGTKNLCKAVSTKSNLKHFIFISSVAVYGVDKGDLITEDCSLNGITPYAKSKILAENWLQKWAKENNIILSIIRLPLVVGPNPLGNLGALIRGIKTGRYLSIGKATAKKSMVWAEDVAAILPKMAEHGGIYNLTDDYHPSFAELETIISSSINKKPPIKLPIYLAKTIAFIGDLLGDNAPFNNDKLKKITYSLTFDDSKARNILKWNPTPVIQKLPSIL